MNYEHWEYEPETRTVLATDIEDGITLATVEPYDDADDIGRLIAAAPEMYRMLFKVLYHSDLDETDVWAVEEIEKLMAHIDYGEEAEHEGTD